MKKSKKLSIFVFNNYFSYEEYSTWIIICINIKISDELIQLYATIWETKQIPREWGHSKLVALWKGHEKGKASNPESYRALQIGSSLCKIMVVTIINRLKKWFESQLLDQQNGFRSSHGTSEGIFIAKGVQQITDRMKKKGICSVCWFI